MGDTEQILQAARAVVISRYHEWLGPWAHSSMMERNADQALRDLNVAMTGTADLREAAFILHPELKAQYECYEADIRKNGSKGRADYRPEERPVTVVELPPFVDGGFKMAPGTQYEKLVPRVSLDDDPPKSTVKRMSLF